MGVVIVDSETCLALRSWTGSETEFNAGFKAEATTDIEVYSRAGGVDTLLTLGVHYSVLLALDGTVTIIPISLPPAPRTIVILRDTSALQGVDFADLQAFDPAVHTILHSRAAMRDAEDKMHRDRALLAPLGETLLDIPPATVRAGKVLGFDGVGQPIATTGGGPGPGGGAPIDAEYLVATANGTLTAERVVTDTATIAWDFSTPGQAKASSLLAARSKLLLATTLNVPSQFATVQLAIDKLAADLDLGGFAHTIKVADGGPYAGFTLRRLVGDGSVTILGNVATPASVAVHGAGQTAVIATGSIGSGWKLNGMRLTSTGAASFAILATGITNVDIANIDLGPTGARQAILAQDKAVVTQSGPITISATEYNFFANISRGAEFAGNGTIRLMSLPALNGFVAGITQGTLLLVGMNFIDQNGNKRQSYSCSSHSNTTLDGFPAGALATLSVGMAVTSQPPAFNPGTLIASINVGGGSLTLTHPATATVTGVVDFDIADGKTYTVQTTNASALVTGFIAQQIARLAAGMAVSGPGIVGGTKIASVNVGALTVTLDTPANATATSALLFDGFNGRRGLLQTQGLIDTNGAGPKYLPGTTPVLNADGTGVNNS